MKRVCVFPAKEATWSWTKPNVVFVVFFFFGVGG